MPNSFGDLTREDLQKVIDNSGLDPTDMTNWSEAEVAKFMMEYEKAVGAKMGGIKEYFRILKKTPIFAGT